MEIQKPSVRKRRTMQSNKSARMTCLSIVLLCLSCISCSLESLFPYASAMKKGNTSYVQGDNQAAELYYREALRIAEEKNDLTDTIITLGYIGRVCAAQNKDQEAEKAFRSRIALADANDLQGDLLPEAYGALIIFLLNKNRCSDANDSFKELKQTAKSRPKEETNPDEQMIMSMFEYRNCR